MYSVYCYYNIHCHHTVALWTRSWNCSYNTAPWLMVITIDYHQPLFKPFIQTLKKGITLVMIIVTIIKND